jgi:hypothetical protein
VGEQRDRRVSAIVRSVSLAVAAGAVAAILFAAHALPSTRAISVGIVLLAAIAFSELFRAVKVVGEPNARVTRRFEEALRPRTATRKRPDELERVEREIVVGATAGVWARHRLLPRLRSAAAARLSMRHGIDLERSPDAARDLLGDDAWELLRPDRLAPADATAPGIPLEQIEALLDRLESL